MIQDSQSHVDFRQLEAALRASLGPDAAVSCRSTADGDMSRLAPCEYPAISGAIEQRKKEFAAGRLAARDAMRRLGRPEAPIPANHDRSPQWPMDLVGSISHTKKVCLAVVALRTRWHSVGVDVEPDSSLPSDIWSMICLPQELQRINEFPENERGRWVARVFTAKEAYYKWVYPTVRTLLDFHEVAIELPPNLNAVQFSINPFSPLLVGVTPARLRGTFTLTQGLIISLILH